MSRPQLLHNSFVYCPWMYVDASVLGGAGFSSICKATTITSPQVLIGLPGEICAPEPSSWFDVALCKNHKIGSPINYTAARVA